jgi:hypothetical protein
MARSAFESFEALWLRGVFMRALSVAVASSLVAAGCASSAEPSPCPEGRLIDLSKVKPASPFDFAAIRAARRAAAGPPASSEWTSAGEPCSGATDAAECLDALNAGPPNSVLELGPELRCGEHGCTYVVTTAGDEIDYYNFGAEVLEFLGPIDSPEDARLWLAGTYEVECGETRVERKGGGFRVTTLRQTDSCPAEFSRVTVQVSAAGKVTELDSQALPSDPNGSCSGTAL